MLPRVLGSVHDSTFANVAYTCTCMHICYLHIVSRIRILHYLMCPMEEQLAHEGDTVGLRNALIANAFEEDASVLRLNLKSKASS